MTSYSTWPTWQPRATRPFVRIEWEQPMGANCMHFLHDVPTVFVSLENPYHLLDVPRVRTYINTYSSNDVAIEALVGKLMGKSPFGASTPWTRSAANGIRICNRGIDSGGSGQSAASHF